MIGELRLSAAPAKPPRVLKPLGFDGLCVAPELLASWLQRQRLPAFRGSRFRMSKVVFQNSLLLLASACLSLACSSNNGLQSIPYQTSANCPAGQTCGINGVCESELGSGGGSGAATSTKGSSGSSSSSSGNANCGCSTACCSEQASASSTSKSGGLTCPDGTYCYGSYYCDLAAGGAVARAIPATATAAPTPPAAGGSAAPAARAPAPARAAARGPRRPPARVGPSGGSVSSLVFAVAGDTRPQTEGDTAGYPTALIEGIYAEHHGRQPAAPVRDRNRRLRLLLRQRLRGADRQLHHRRAAVTRARTSSPWATTSATATPPRTAAPDNTGRRQCTPNFTNFFNMLGHVRHQQHEPADARDRRPVLRGRRQLERRDEPLDREVRDASPPTPGTAASRAG